MVLVKIIMIILCVIIALRVLGYLAIRFLAYKLKKNLERRFPQEHVQKKEGEITINMPGKSSKNTNFESEYTDYEEIK